MTRKRSLVSIELVPAQAGKWTGLVSARWQRADGSSGEAVVQLRLRTAERWYIVRVIVDLPTTEKLRDIPLARIEAAINSTPAIHDWIRKGVPAELVEKARRAAAERPRLERPAGRHLDDGFYKQVADAYKAAVAHGLPPAKTLAEDSDTPPGTVARWIAQARGRDYLPPGQPGKVSA